MRWKKKLILLLFLVFLVYGYDSLISPSYPWRYEKVEQSFYLLQKSMTKEQVIKLVGYPKFIREFGSEKGKMTEEQWILHFRSYSKRIPVCTFQISTNVLIKAEFLTQRDLD